MENGTNSIKDQLFKNLNRLVVEAENLAAEKKTEAKSLLFQAEEIVSEFNKGKISGAHKEMNLDEKDLTKLKKIVDEIWQIVARRGLEVRPKPDITFRIG